MFKNIVIIFIKILFILALLLVIGYLKLGYDIEYYNSIREERYVNEHEGKYNIYVTYFGEYKYSRLVIEKENEIIYENVFSGDYFDMGYNMSNLNFYDDNVTFELENGIMYQIYYNGNEIKRTHTDIIN